MTRPEWEWENAEKAEIGDFLWLKCGNVATHTYPHTFRWCSTLRPSCGWKKSSPCEPYRVSYAALTAEQIYHNTVRTYQLLEPWWLLHLGCPSGVLERHHNPVDLVPLSATHSAWPGSQHIGVGSLTQHPWGNNDDMHYALSMVALGRMDRNNSEGVTRDNV